MTRTILYGGLIAIVLTGCGISKKPHTINKVQTDTTKLEKLQKTELVQHMNASDKEQKSIEEIVEDLMQSEERIVKYKSGKYYSSREKAEMDDEQAQIGKLKNNIYLLKHAIAVNTGRDRSKLEKELKQNLTDLEYWKEELEKAKKNFNDYLNQTRDYLEANSSKYEKDKLELFNEFLNEKQEIIKKQTIAKNISGGIYKMHDGSGNPVFVIITTFGHESRNSDIYRGKVAMEQYGRNAAKKMLMDYASNFTDKKIKYTSPVHLWGNVQAVDDTHSKAKAIIMYVGGNKKLTERVWNSLEEYDN